MTNFQLITNCIHCGAPKVEPLGDGMYRCTYCGDTFSAYDLNNYGMRVHKELIQQLSGVVSEQLLKQREHDIGNARQNLFNALKEEYTDSYKIIGCCRELKKYLPDDFQANAFERLNERDIRKANEFFDSIDVNSVARYYIKDILDFMLKSMTSSNLQSLKSLADRGLNGEEKTKYLNAIEEEAQKYDDGVYDVEKQRDVFVAHSSKDIAIVNEKCNYLKNKGIECFISTYNLRHGKGSKPDYEKYLRRAMHNSKCFVFFSSHNSRKKDCDAMALEVPYIRDNEPDVKRIEYILDDYLDTEKEAKNTLKPFFGKERCRDIDDLVKLINEHTKGVIKPRVKYCIACGAENPAEKKYCIHCDGENFVPTYMEYANLQQAILDRKHQKEKEEIKKQLLAVQEKIQKEISLRLQLQNENESLKSNIKQLLSQTKFFTNNNISSEKYDKTVFKIKDVTLYKYNDAIHRACVPNVVKVIGENSFAKSKKLTDVIVPEGVTQIASNAFADCEELKHIVLPESISELGNSAFLNCKSLKNIILPTSIKQIKDNTFKRCLKLQKISIFNGIEAILDNAFEECISLVVIKLPDSVTEIGCGAFKGCRNLMEISLPDNLSELPAEVFYQCSNITNITLPSKLIKIGNSAIADCKNLSQIIIPNNVCSIGDYAFIGCKSLINITIPYSVTDIGIGVFADCSGLEKIKVDIKNVRYVSVRNCLIEKETRSLVCGCKNSIISSEYVSIIGEKAFYGSTGLMKIIIPEGITTIGKEAFYGCNNLKEVVIPETVSVIGEGAFSGCENLIIFCRIPKEKIPDGWVDGWNGQSKVIWGYRGRDVVNIPGIESYDQNDFDISGTTLIKYKRKITKVTVPVGVKTIGQKAFSNHTTLKEIALPDGLLAIEESAFLNCKMLQYADIPNSVSVIGAGAFQNCCSIKKITFPSNLTSIESSVLSGCNNLENVVMPAGITSIGLAAFCGCIKLKSINMPAGITSLGSSAFFNCTELTSIIIPQGIKDIKAQVFKGCKSLTTIIFPEDLTSIGLEAFAWCESLNSVVIPETVTVIGESAFSNCKGLTSITIPESVTTIGVDAFRGCYGLTIHCRRGRFSKPKGWQKGWNGNCEIVWNYKG